ncbi:DNA phosphorothioation-associated DGQHR protein 1 [Escherichia marmotae]|uniref:DNA phosphorothioation-associated DGQHR protein 1 n=1 Tax=Escherichia TaxID=561 RepID=UPI000CF75208|nr:MULTISPECIES: DNA phosphorothioation-associated DGQHR protein 1 [Escherichia]EFN9756232.1 DGQHR domain-containing protein [Escherichia coli]MBB2417241.1 DGQHR domain-containing protein [Escherichia sp. 11.1596]MBB2421354.1 DGQHR domain-containing protein [Escherichia sp. 12.2610]MBB2423489.1 DGQHR domain-containing protein [Escherichia sp. 11.1597]MBB2431719.1 DGQHR domain-containing protein [Escherichia sp. 11.1600]
MNNEIRLPAIKIEQPIGVFYAVSISSEVLSKVSFSSRAQYSVKNGVDGLFSFMKGNQRELDEKRSRLIGKYIDSVESTFPNSIILGANFDQNGNLIEDSNIRWRIEEVNGHYTLVIPSDELKIATIIDGQHRLSGFEFSERKSMDLLCSVFIDLPAPYQAYIFATININQKKVDKSLAYDLFGFRVDDEPKELWSPEKLAVFITRKLNKLSKPLENKIRLGAPNDIDTENTDRPLVSLSTIVDGIMKLITGNPKLDRDELLNYKNKNGRKALVSGGTTRPLRQFYISSQDEFIESVIFRFFDIMDSTVWTKQNKNSYLLKTIGFQAQFDFLREYLSVTSDFELKELKGRILSILDVDFSNVFFTASGIGATRIKNIILIKTGFKSIEVLSEHKDFEDYKKVLMI